MKYKILTLIIFVICKQNTQCTMQKSHIQAEEAFITVSYMSGTLIRTVLAPELEVETIQEAVQLLDQALDLETNLIDLYCNQTTSALYNLVAMTINERLFRVKLIRSGESCMFLTCILDDIIRLPGRIDIKRFSLKLLLNIEKIIPWANQLSNVQMTIVYYILEKHKFEELAAKIGTLKTLDEFFVFGEHSDITVVMIKPRIYSTDGVKLKHNRCGMLNQCNSEEIKYIFAELQSLKCSSLEEYESSIRKIYDTLGRSEAFKSIKKTERCKEKVRVAASLCIWTLSR